MRRCVVIRLQSVLFLFTPISHSIRVSASVISLTHRRTQTQLLLLCAFEIGCLALHVGRWTSGVGRRALDVHIEQTSAANATAHPITGRIRSHHFQGMPLSAYPKHRRTERTVRANSQSEQSVHLPWCDGVVVVAHPYPMIELIKPKG